MSTYEISQLVENDGDDSDRDPDYIVDEAGCSSSDDEQEDSSSEQDMFVKAGKRTPAEEEIRVYMDPPVERPDGDTDKDSDDSDEPTGLVSHLPRRLLGEHAEKQRRRRAPLNKQHLEAASDTDDDDDLPIREDPTKWRKANSGLVGSRVPPFVKVAMSIEDREKLEGLTTALEYYKLFQPDSFVQEIVAQSKLYAIQKNLKQASNSMSAENYRCMEAMLLHGGYAPVPRRRMLWEDMPDCRNRMVADSIRLG